MPPGRRGGPEAGAVIPPALAFLLRPFHVGPATWGDASSSGPGRGPPGGPGSVGPHHARAADLPSTRPRGSNFLLGPAQATGAVPGPRGQARAGHRGHLRSPIPDPGDRAGCGCARRLFCVLELAAVCSL
ncbi:hypothetical protein NN561_004596 [Cricetulus griseus]